MPITYVLFYFLNAMMTYYIITYLWQYLLIGNSKDWTSVYVNVHHYSKTHLLYDWKRIMNYVKNFKVMKCYGYTLEFLYNYFQFFLRRILSMHSIILLSFFFQLIYASIRTLIEFLIDILTNEAMLTMVEIIWRGLLWLEYHPFHFLLNF